MAYWVAILPRSKKSIAALLQTLSQRFDRKFLSDDPVFFVHPYSDPRDQEVVGLISALLAFGNVKTIHQSIQKVLEVMGSSPADFIANFDFKRQGASLNRLGHRWVRSGDIRLLFVVLKKILRRHASLKSFFLEGYNDGDLDVSGVLHCFSKGALSLAGSSDLSRGFRYFFPSPINGSPCKRLNLFLRWMVRPADGIDLGLWTEIPPSKLVIPLDTHIYQFGTRFGLSRTKTANWRFARDLTDFLKTIDPVDPVRFDFPICHYGMEEGW